MMEDKEQEAPGEIEAYAGGSVTSKNAPVPRWLKISYVLLIIWGAVWFYYFYNGSYGWLDRGYWNQLQRAALTTYPEEEK